MSGNQHVDAHPGQHKTGDAGDVVHTHRDPAHSHRYGGRQTQSATARRQASFENRLVHQDVADQRPVDHFLRLG